MKTIVSILFFISCSIRNFGQNIIITSASSQDSIPNIEMWIFENPILYFPQDRKTLVYKDSKFTTSYPVTQPHWIEIYTTPILLLPGENIVGTLYTNGNLKFSSTDTNNINFLIQQILERAHNIKGDYSQIVDTVVHRSERLRLFFDSSLHVMQTPLFMQKYKINVNTLLAINELLASYIAWYYISGFVKSANFEKNKLNDLIQNKININSGKYWLQNQKGIYFLNKYFFSISLPHYNNNFAKAIANDKFFKDRSIKKYLYYQYFNKIFETNDIPNNPKQIDSLFNKYIKEYQFSPIELKVLAGLKNKRSINAKNIINDFAAQKLVNSKNIALSDNEKKLLIQDNKNLIIYYWASWCPPCVTFLESLKTDLVFYNGIKCNLLFISIDSKRNDWLKRKFSILNSQNSFNLPDITSPSLFNIYIKGISLPHLFLIQNGVMQNQNLDKSKIVLIK